MIVIQSSSDDLSTDDVEKWISHYRKRVQRLNDTVRINSILLDNDISFSLEDKKLELSKIRSYWYRRGISEFTPKELDREGLQNSLASPLMEEVNRMLSKVKISFGNNSIGKYTDNEIDKLEMLTSAMKVGLIIPKTIITGNSEFLQDFKAKCECKVITKAIAINEISFKLNKDIKCIFNLTTTLVDNTYQTNEKLEDCLPALYQQYIEKKYELRIFYLKGKFYPMAIFSQNNERTKIDYRNYDHDLPNRMVPFVLPKRIRKKLKRLMTDLGLQTGSIDMIITDKNEFVFLEVNPVGQYHWLEKNCNYRISKDIALELIGKPE